tara:strand:- start:161 stop:505 length:345 start_codon:yes stop_codon:yes gene_type:complete
MGAMLVFIANTFTLMYVGALAPDQAIWYGAVSGAFTHTVLATVAEAAEGEVEEKPKRPAGNPNLFPVPPPQQYGMPQQPPPQPPMQQQQQYVPQQPAVPGINQAVKQVEQELEA